VPARSPERGAISATRPIPAAYGLPYSLPGEVPVTGPRREKSCLLGENLNENNEGGL
jgi:hypothetical protein